MGNRKTKSYSLEFKQSSVKLALGSDQPISVTARELGVHEATLHGWIKRHGSGNQVSANAVVNADAQAEIKRLKKELCRVTQERDILKKAAAYFASETQ